MGVVLTLEVPIVRSRYKPTVIDSRDNTTVHTRGRKKLSVNDTNKQNVQLTTADWRI